MPVSLRSRFTVRVWFLVLAAALLLLAACTPAREDTPAGSPSTTTPATAAEPTQPTATLNAPSAQAPAAMQPEEGVAATGEVGTGGVEGAPPVSVPTPVQVAEATATAARAKETRVIALDPGHGGPETGAWANGLSEKELNLEIALRLADKLRAEGYEVVLTRDSDRAVSPLYTGGGYAGGLRNDMQARVDIANAAEADLFISIHNNGSTDPGQSGTEVWYNVQREFSERNVTLAKLVQRSLLERIRALGYPAVDRGIKEDTNFRIYRGRPYNLYVLGPGTGPREHEPTQMPGVLGEALILTNPGDAAMLHQDSTLDAIAAGYRDAVVAYFDIYPE